MKKVAFFDVDGTIFRSSLLIEIVEQFIKDGTFPSEVEDVYADSYRAWRNREGSYEAYIDDVVQAFHYCQQYVQLVGGLARVG